MKDLVGQLISKRYLVDDFLGKGGMAEVYKVWDQKRSAHLAMKILHADLAEDKVFLRRFRREAQTLAKLQHPNIVRFYGLEQDDDLVYILMDYVEGTTLRKEIFQSKGPFSNKRILEIMRPVCAALSYAHSSGFVHCDVKPANIMISKNGAIYVSDFGIARMSEAATMTMVGAGTPAYMAPEQARGENPIPQSDIYSLGVILYELFTGGERPFIGENARITGSTGEKIRWEQVNLQAPNPGKFNPNLHPSLSNLVIKCLNKNPQSRYENPLDLVDGIEKSKLIESQSVEKKSVQENNQANEEAIIDLRKNDQIGILMKSERNKLFGNLWGKVGFVQNYLRSNSLLKTFKQEKSILSRQDNKQISAGNVLNKNWMWWISIVIIASLLYASGSFQSSVTSSNGKLNFTSDVNFSNGKLYFTSDRTSKAEIYKLVGAKAIQVTYTSGDAQSWSPVLSNTGVMYFTSDRNGKAEIYKLMGTKVTQVTYTSGNAQSWSPVLSNTGVMYFTSNRTGKAEIYKLVGTKVTQVTNTSGDAQSWSPVLSNTGVMYFVSDRTGKAEIYKLVGTKVTQVTYTSGDTQSWAPVLSNTGVMYFTSDRTGKVEVYKLVGTKVTQVTYTSGNAQSWSPVLSNTGVMYFTSDRTGKAEIYKLVGTKVIQVTNTLGNAQSWNFFYDRKCYIGICNILVN